jgi:phospholipid transport system substrate-binding protein
MKNVRKIFAILLIAAGLGLAAPMAHAVSKGSSSPTDVVQKFYDTLTAVMKDGNDLGYSGRYKKLAPALKSAYNLPLMTRIAVGPVWTQATPDEQKQLISAFSDFSVATYANRFVKYDGEQFQVIDQKPATGGGVIVETKLIPGGNDKPVQLNYLMKQDDQGSWRIVDVYLDGSISELATRRSEFTDIVQRDGIPALVDQLGNKAKAMGPS